MMTMEGSTLIVNVMTPGGRGSCTESGHISHHSVLCIIDYSINIQHIACYFVKG